VQTVNGKSGNNVSLAASDVLGVVTSVNAKNPVCGNVTLTAGDVGAMAGTKSSSAPSSPSTDDLWYDKANDLWKRWNGTAWFRKCHFCVG
jgi:hypothetical protein